jgi:hypothetical protein
MYLFFALSSAACFAGLGVFFVDYFLRLDSHVDDIRCFGLEPAFC